MIACRTLAAAALLSLPAMAMPQSIRGIVVDQLDSPVAGVLVVLLDDASGVLARSLSNARGEFRLTAPRAGAYRVSTRRIGFNPVTSGRIALGAAQEVVQRLVLTGLRVALDTVRVASRSPCRILAGDSATVTFAIWEQARTALNAAEVTARERAFSATTVAYERTLDPDGRRVRQQTASISEGFVTQPWRAIPPESLRVVGYVVQERDGSTTYHAPGLAALLANSFIEDHCFRLAESGTNGVGIAFEPNAIRRRVSDIVGTVWLDRQSAELRSLEYRYVNAEGESEGSSGAMTFVRLANGMWAIARWNIRIPIVERVIGSRSAGGDQTRVVEFKVFGGDLALVRSGRDTLWLRPPTVMAGEVTDSSSGSAVPAARVTLRGTPWQAVTDARGRFTMPGVVPSEYTLEVRTASLDSVSAMHESQVVFADSSVPVRVRVPDARHIIATLCASPGGAAASSTGIVMGRVSVRGDSVPLSRFGRVAVVAEWTETPIRSGGLAPGGRQARWLEAATDARGGFRICGVPLNTALLLRTATDSGSAEPARVTIPPDRRFVRADLALERRVNRGAVFTGTVFVDGAQQPIPDVEVALPVYAMEVRSNDRGKFRLTDIPPGTHQVLARRLGFGPVDTGITFEANQTIERALLLSRVVVIDSVFVTAERPVPGDFQENRKLGLGLFLTRADLATHEGRPFSEVLRPLPGLKVVDGRGNRAWIAGSRGQRGGKCVEREGGDTACDCFAQVYLDNLPLYRGNEGGIVPDINRIAPEQIEAIEYYAGPAQTPAKYSSPNAACGVLVIWTRRSP